MTKQTFTFRRVQSGFWGETQLKRTITVRAQSEDSARAIVQRRPDARKRLSNGDTLSWTLAELVW